MAAHLLLTFLCFCSVSKPITVHLICRQNQVTRNLFLSNAVFAIRMEKIYRLTKTPINSNPKLGKDGHLLVKQIICICQIYTSTLSSFLHPFMYSNTIHQNFVCWRHFSFISLLQLSTSAKKKDTTTTETALYMVIGACERK